MRKNIIAYIFLLVLIIDSSWANIVFNLKNRLDKIDSFYASFTQKITDSSGSILQEGKGYLWVKRPNLFSCHMIQPDENMLVSDGNTLWFYNPFVKQVTITWLKDKVKNTPLILIIDNQVSNWQQYSINQKSDIFILIPKDHGANIKKLMLNVSQNGIIRELSFIESNNHNITYQFKLQKKNLIDESKFIFTPPRDTTIDDQRY